MYAHKVKLRYSVCRFMSMEKDSLLLYNYYYRKNNFETCGLFRKASPT